MMPYAFTRPRYQSPDEKAEHVAQSIVRHGYALCWDTWQRYGLTRNGVQQVRVRLAVQRLRDGGDADGR
jgi:hypothetical protein